MREGEASERKWMGGKEPYSSVDGLHCIRISIRISIVCRSFEYLG